MLLQQWEGNEQGQSIYELSHMMTSAERDIDMLTKEAIQVGLAKGTVDSFSIPHINMNIPKRTRMC